MTIRITVILENTANAPKLLAEHGLAYWIERGSEKVLFDAGQGVVLASNAYKHFEDIGGPFFLDRDCGKPDPMSDDQSLFFETNEGTVVLLGCAHSGVINTLRHVRTLTEDRPIHAVLGGMHLVRASSERLSRTIEAFRRLGVERLGPAHCTGAAAIVALWNAFPGQVLPCHVGSRFEFESLVPAMASAQSGNE